MAEPVRRRLRPARRRGLTSPDRSVPATAPDGHPEPRPEPGTPDTPQNRRAAASPRPDPPRKLLVQKSDRETIYRNKPVDRGLEWVDI